MLQLVFYEKLNQKSSKNQLQCRQGMSWGRLGGVLEHLKPSWGRPGGVSGVLGRPGVIVSRLGAVLELAWGRLGAVLGLSWAVLTPSWARPGAVLGRLGGS